jgi:hypothetical protein
MEVFFQKYSCKIFDRSSPDGTGCRLWQGSVKKGGEYGVIKAKFPGVGWCTKHAHHLQYMVNNKLMTIPRHLEVSHLCHKPLCVLLEHLAAEPHHVNTARTKCVNRSKCCGHKPYPDCILVIGVVESVSLKIVPLNSCIFSFVAL